MGSKKAPDPKLPTASQLAPLIDLQAQYNRVGVRTPFGSQRYEIGPDGRSSTMVTDIGPEGQALVGRAVGLGMTDSARLQAPQQVNSIAGALANRIGSRFGLPAGEGFQLSQAPARPSPKPVQQPQLPQPSGGMGNLDGPPPGTQPMPGRAVPTVGGNRPLMVGRSFIGDQVRNMRES